MLSIISSDNVRHADQFSPYGVPTGSINGYQENSKNSLNESWGFFLNTEAGSYLGSVLMASHSLLYLGGFVWYDVAVKAYDNYLLDWDGCLGQTLEVWLNGYRETYQEFGSPQTDEEITRFSFNTQHGPLERGIEDLELFMESLMSRIDNDLKVVDMYPGARELIATIKSAGHNVALVTSSPRLVIEAVIRHNKLTDMFDAVITADEVVKHKPDPEVIFKALEAMSLGKETLGRTVIVGDSKSDLGVARNAGIDSVLFYPQSHALFYDLDALKALNPTYIFEDFVSLAKAIKQSNL